VRQFIIVDAPQRSEAWFAARAGLLTGSVAGEMLSKTKSGESAGRRNLRVRLLLERLTGRPQDSGFVSPAMLAGIEREEAAFSAYESLTGNVAVRTGFLKHVTHMAGCSLDGHMGDFERLLSIKCRQPSGHLDVLKSGVIPSAAMAQIRHELWITGAAAHEYFSWNPDFPDALQSRIVTVTRAAAKIPEYEDAALAFLAEVDQVVAAIRSTTRLGETMEELLANK
jgi:hypothetical protein